MRKLIIHLHLVALACLVAPVVFAGPALAQSPYQWSLDSFSFPADTCGDPIRAHDANSRGVDLFENHEKWRQCQKRLQEDDRRALRMLITMKLGGQWQTIGDNFAWAVADDCNCQEDVRGFIGEMAAREQRRQRLNDELMADIAANRSLEAVMPVDK